MSKRILLSGWLLSTLLSFLCQAPAQDRVPVQAELVRAIDAGRVKIGESVLAKVAVKWQTPQCTLREGAVLKGRIVAGTTHSKTEKNSQIALLFESAQCNGTDLKPLALTVAAVLASDPYQDRNLYENQPLSEAVGLSIGGGGGGAAGVGVGGGVINSNMRSVTAAAATVYVSPQKYKGPTAVMPGQVVGIRGLKLRVGDGPEGSSVLTMSGHNVRLESGYQIMLVPNLNTAAPVSNKAGTNAVPSVAVAPIAKPASVPDESIPLNETEVCSPPQCTIAFEPGEAETTRVAAWASFPVGQLGYAPARPDQEMYSFDYGSAMSYLGAGELLFTFNPHVLKSQRRIRERTGDCKSSRTRRSRTASEHAEDYRHRSDRCAAKQIVLVVKSIRFLTARMSYLFAGFPPSNATLGQPSTQATVEICRYASPEVPS
jgi:hypothetical protein